jgi:hypothetical protein
MNDKLGRILREVAVADIIPAFPWRDWRKPPYKAANFLRLYSRGARYEFRRGHRLSRQMLLPLPSKPFPIHHSLVIIPFNATQFQLLLEACWPLPLHTQTQNIHTPIRSVIFIDQERQNCQMVTFWSNNPTEECLRLLFLILSTVRVH